MAIREEVIIDVQETGYDEATKKAEKLAKANKDVEDSSGGVAKGMKQSGEAVLENGGAMGLLNDATGGYAMMVKDAVEASALFTKSQKLAAIQQKIYTAVVGTSSGALKVFKLSLAATGIGAIVLAVILLITNFKKVKETVYNLIPGLKAVGDAIGGIINWITDLVGATSDASRAVDKMAEDAAKSLAKSERYLEANGDKYDEYTRRKMQANIDYQKKVQELAEDEKLTEEEKLKWIAQYRDKAQREIDKADADRAAEREKKRKEEADKIAEEEKKAADEAKRIADDAAKEQQRRRDEAVAKEKERVANINKIIEDYRKREEDAAAKSNLDKINLEEKRAIAELETLKATEEQKAKIREYYNNLRKEDEKRLQDELAAIQAQKDEAVKNLELDQKQWEVDNEVDPLTKLQKQKDLMQEQAQLEIDRLQKTIENANASATEQANAEIELAKVKQDLAQAIADQDKAIKEQEKQNAEEQKERDKAVADNRKDVMLKTAQIIFDLAGKGAEFAKGMAASQAIQDTYASAVAAYKSTATIPLIGPGLAPVAAAAATAAGLLNVKKILATKKTETSAGGAGGATAGAVPAAPAFNLVQGTGANQIAEAVTNQSQPVQAYVVSSNVTTAQEMERNIVTNGRV